MNISQVQSAQVGFALFDAWHASIDRLHHRRKTHQGSPLVHAAFVAFENYLDSKELEHSVQIAGVAAQINVSMQAQLSTYGLNPQGNGVITIPQMAPLLALNLIA